MYVAKSTGGAAGHIGKRDAGPLNIALPLKACSA